MQQQGKSTSFPPFRPLQSIKWSVPKPNMGNSHQSLLTQMTGVPRAFQKLQRRKKRGEYCLRSHWIRHLKAQPGKNVVLDLLGCKLRFYFFSLHPAPFRLTHFLCSANNREAAPYLLGIIVHNRDKLSLSALIDKSQTEPSRVAI